MTRRQRLRATSQDLHEIDTLFDLKLELEEQQLRVAARRIATNRELEDVDYWREHSGWFDDDEPMKEYNTGVYTSLYSIDDNEGGMDLNSNLLRTAGQICGALVGVLILVVLVRAFSRTSTSTKKGNRRRSASRSRSKSRTRSRSRRREREAKIDNYELMENSKG